MKENVNLQTGEITPAIGMRTIVTTRPNGTKRVQLDYSNCIGKTDPTGAHETDINYLVSRYSTNELANYLAAKASQRQQITGIDLTREPEFDVAKGEVYRLEQAFDALSDDVKRHFKNVHQFLKYTDDPKNIDQLIRLGLITKKEVETIQNPAPQTTIQTQTNDDKEPTKIKKTTSTTES